MTRLTFDCRFAYDGGFQLAAAFESSDRVGALFGPSGAGKSTVFALIAGLLRPQAGRIALDDEVFVDVERRTFLAPERRRIGVVFQDQRLFPHLSVRKNLEFGLRYARARAASSVDYDRVVRLLDLGSLADRMPATLSGGQRQRVAVGRALLRGPRLLLMDEPVSALDEAAKEQVLEYVRRVVDEFRLPTLFVSHDQADVRRAADRVIVLDGGRVVDTAPVDEAFEPGRWARRQRPLTPVNWLRVGPIERRDGGWAGAVGGQTAHLPAAAEPFVGREAHVQFLPRDVTLAEREVVGLSARNQWHGTVREVIVSEDRVFAAIDIGQFVWAEVTPGVVAELKLAPGRAIVSIVKASALSVGG